MSDLKRHIGQKVALATAAFCALLALPAFGLFIWLWWERGLGDTWVPSALSTVGFLGACAVVLYVTSRPQPPLPDEAAATVEATADPRTIETTAGRTGDS